MSQGFVVRNSHRGAMIRIVNLSSGAAVRAFPGLAAYCGSKAALRMAGMAFAAELESPLRPTATPDVAILSYEPGVRSAEQSSRRNDSNREPVLRRRRAGVSGARRLLRQQGGAANGGDGLRRRA